MCQKIGCQLAGSVSFLATKMIKSHVADKARSAATLFVRLARHPEKSNHPSQRNTARNGSSATVAAALAKIHVAERAQWIMACRDRVLCAVARAACVGLTRASAPAGFRFEAPTSNCAWEALHIAVFSNSVRQQIRGNEVTSGCAAALQHVATASAAPIARCVEGPQSRLVLS